MLQSEKGCSTFFNRGEGIRYLNIFMVALVLFSSLPVKNASAANLTHSEMMDLYGEGYGNALFETVLEVQTKAMVNQEVNRGELQSYVDNSLGYWKSRYDAYEGVKQLSGVEKYKQGLIEMGTGALTLGDLALDLLDSIFAEGSNTEFPDSCSSFKIENGSASYKVLRAPCDLSFAWFKTSLGHSAGNGYPTGEIRISGNNSYIVLGPYNFYSNVNLNTSSATVSYGEVQSFLSSIKTRNPDSYVYLKYKGQTVQNNPNSVTNNTFGDRNRTYINNPSSRPTTYVSQLQPQLSCSDGIRAVEIDGAGGFKYPNGMKADTNNCTVIWQKPIVQVDENGNITVINPDGSVTEPDKKPVVNPKDKIVKVEDKGEGCDGVLCFLGAVTSGMADLVGSVLGLVDTLLEGLFNLIKEILIPSNTFWTENTEKLKSKSLNEQIKKTTKEVEQLGSAGGGSFDDVTVSLMGASDLKIVDSSSVNSVLDHIHSWVRGFMIPLLLFYNINQLYKLVRGTSLIGIGKSGGGK